MTYSLNVSDWSSLELIETRYRKQPSNVSSFNRFGRNLNLKLSVSMLIHNYESLRHNCDVFFFAQFPFKDSATSYFLHKRLFERPQWVSLVSCLPVLKYNRTALTVACELELQVGGCFKVASPDVWYNANLTLVLGKCGVCMPRWIQWLWQERQKVHFITTLSFKPTA